MQSEIASAIVNGGLKQRMSRGEQQRLVRYTAGGVFTWQRTHGGLRSTEFDTDEEIVQFDRLIRDNNFHIGFNVARSFRHFEVFGGYVSYVSGTDTHAGDALTFGISLPFER